MSSRQTFLLISAAAMLALAGVAFFELQEADDLEGDYEIPSQVPTDPGPGPEGGNGETIQMQGHAGVTGGNPAEPTVRIQRQVSDSATTGIIDGRIALDISVLNKFHAYTIEVTEEINENARREGSKKPFHKVQRFAYDHIGTPFFTLEGIPFSQHGYLVRLHVAQLNGSQTRVHITKNKPCGEVQLSLAPGVIFTVLLRDQRQIPRQDLSVQMIPEGNPPDRPVYRGTSSNYGQVLFENVVQGDYKIYVGRLNAPMNVPEKVTVQPVNAVYSKGRRRTVGVQSALVLVPSGAPVTVEVTDRFGYGVANADLEMHQIEVTRYFAYKAKTDANGRHVFEHLPVGKYQLSVHKPGFGRRTQKLQIKEEDRAKLQKIQLRR